MSRRVFYENIFYSSLFQYHFRINIIQNKYFQHRALACFFLSRRGVPGIISETHVCADCIVPTSLEYHRTGDTKKIKSKKVNSRTGYTVINSAGYPRSIYYRTRGVGSIGEDGGLPAMAKTETRKSQPSRRAPVRRSS